MKLVVDISGHGFGHLGQISSVLRQLLAHPGDLELVIRSKLPDKVVHNFLGTSSDSIRFAEPPVDIGLLMHGPHRPDIEKSYQAYVQLHHDFQDVVAHEARQLAQLDADLLLSDVGYVGLAAAAKTGLPAIALCSLHWGEIVSHYFKGRAQTAAIHKDIMAAYNSASSFLLAAPRKTIADLVNLVNIPPLFRHWGKNCQTEIRAQLGLLPAQKIGLICFGGISHGLPGFTLPPDPNWVWLVPDNWSSGQMEGKLLPISRLKNMEFLDLLASSDLVVGKTGYNLFLESAAYGIPCLFMPRPDWPESAELENWMIKNGYGTKLEQQDLSSADWLTDWQDHAMKSKTSPPASGHAEVVKLIVDQFVL